MRRCSILQCLPNRAEDLPALEQAILAGLYTVFSAKEQLTTEILVTEIQSAQPLSVTRAEEVQAIREWAKKRAVAAD